MYTNIICGFFKFIIFFDTFTIENIVFNVIDILLLVLNILLLIYVCIIIGLFVYYIINKLKETFKIQTFPPDGNVVILNYKDGSQVNQQKVDEIYKKHGLNSSEDLSQFGTNRTLILLMPGNYDINISIGYYMSVAGLGQSPEDVTVTSINSYMNQKGKSTDMFWRSVENLTIIEKSIWSVSQACPMRRIICNNDILLQDPGPNDYASGGFMADSYIKGTITPGGQQQWCTRNTKMKNWTNLNMWNYVFIGCVDNDNNQLTSNSQCGQGNNYYSEQKTPQIAQKPTLFFNNDDKQYYVLRPSTTTNNSGQPSSWNEGGQIPLSKFYITKPTDTATIINNQINNGKHIFLSPGIYTLEDIIVVNKDNTMILGYGMPTLQVVNGPAIIVKDVDNVVVSAVILSVSDNSKFKLISSLIQWGTNTDIHPGYMYDIFTRVGGDTLTNVQCDKMVIINSSGVICDNLWLWRADHGVNDSKTIGWNINIANNALEVNGNNVIIYGLAAEHTQKNIVNWNGNNGINYFYQSEMAYDIPDDSDLKDVVSYNVTGSNHKAYGLGVYAFFGIKDTTLPKIVLNNAFMFPNNATIKNIYVMNMSKKEGGFEYVYNNKGNVPISTGAPVLQYICDK